MADYPYFPLFVDLSGKKLLVIGAGHIAKRRIETLLRFAPSVTAAAPEALPEVGLRMPVSIWCVMNSGMLSEDRNCIGLLLSQDDTQPCSLAKTRISGASTNQNKGALRNLAST